MTGFRSDDKLYLRAIEVGDAARYVAWMNDPALSRFMLFGRTPVSERREAEWISALGRNENEIVFAMCLVEDDRHIGGCGLHAISWMDRFATVAIFIGEKDLWGQGLGTRAMRLVLDYAFFSLNLNRVELTVFGNNQRAQTTYRKLGFVEEGRQRQRRFRDGGYVDEIAMAMLRDEWAQTRSSGLHQIDPMVHPQHL